MCILGLPVYLLVFIFELLILNFTLFRYVHQSEIADHYFPPTGKDGFHPDFKIQEYSGFGFWREPIPAVETPVLEDHEEKK